VSVQADESRRFGPYCGDACGTLRPAGQRLGSASDAFFPFRDNVDEAAKLGVSAIIHRAVRSKTKKSIAAANEHGITMAFTGIRHFKH
jgi:phosphoribosylaminoimidazolecarboxamide formyltransferase/IMP cyclohydrolase